MNESSSSNKRLNLPNIITIFRLFLIPIFIFVYFNNPEENLLYSVIIFFIAGLSDLLDGYLARKNNQITTFGTVMDPLADKLMLLTALVSYAVSGLIPYVILILVAIKETLMIVGGIVVYRWGIVNPANYLGKFVTFSFYVGILTLLFQPTIGTILLFISAGLSFIAGFSYVKSTLDKRKERNSKQNS